MKYFVSILAIICLFTACCRNNDNSKLAILKEICVDYTANATAIEEKKLEMLSIADNVGNFLFSDDTEFQEQDRNVYRLKSKNGDKYMSIKCYYNRYAEEQSAVISNELPVKNEE